MEIQLIHNKIRTMRGCRVMLDFDLAELYETETKRLKEAVRRNIGRFPDDFMFELTKDEYDSLRPQIASLKNMARGKHARSLQLAAGKVLPFFIKDVNPNLTQNEGY